MSEQDRDRVLHGVRRACKLLGLSHSGDVQPLAVSPEPQPTRTSEQRRVAAVQGLGISGWSFEGSLIPAIN